MPSSQPEPPPASPSRKNTADHDYLIGIDLGGSSVKAAALTCQGHLLDQVNTPFDPAAPMAWARLIQEQVQRFQHAQHHPPLGIGLSAPGLPDQAGRTIAYMPDRLPGLVGLDWTELLQSPQPVPVLNDAQAALLGEVWQGAARNLQNVILLTLGTGVGGAAMVDGHLLRGHTGKAGHLGHVCLDMAGPPDICGVPGSLEDLVGNATLRERADGRYENTHALLAAHQAGDPEATRLWLKSVDALACAIVSFTNVLDPEAVIVGGGIATAGPALFEPLRRRVREMEWQVCGHQVRILPAQLGPLAGVYGAARRASLE